MGFSQAAELVERSILEIVRLDAEAGVNVVADQFQPFNLFGGEGRSGVPQLVFFLGGSKRRDAASTGQPAFKSCLYRFREGLEDGLLLQGRSVPAGRD